MPSLVEDGEGGGELEELIQSTTYLPSRRTKISEWGRESCAQQENLIAAQNAALAKDWKGQMKQRASVSPVGR